MDKQWQANPASWHLGKPKSNWTTWSHELNYDVVMVSSDIFLWLVGKGER